MALNLRDIKPHKVSRDLSGYITYIYGEPKTGKTTFATQMPNHLLLAFERGYDALPEVIAQDITSWGKMKEVLRELKKPENLEYFKSIIVDTIDIAADMCQQYICSQLGIENIGDGGFENNGWVKYKKEFEETFRTLSQLGYAVVFISHVKSTTKKDKVTKQEWTSVKPSAQSSALAIIENMADIYGYVHQVKLDNGQKKAVMTIRTGDDIACGGRFKYLPDEIDFSYDNLQKALTDAIDKEAAEKGNKFVTDERTIAPIAPSFDYDALMAEFKTVVEKAMTTNQSNGLKITAIVDKYLGKGKKVSEATPDQAELISLIVNEIKEL